MDMHLVAEAFDIEPVERLVRALRPAIGGTERGEVVLADEALRRGMHGVGISGVATRHAGPHRRSAAPGD